MFSPELLMFGSPRLRDMPTGFGNCHIKQSAVLKYVGKLHSFSAGGRPSV